SSRSSTLRRIASKMAGCTGSVFVFCDIQATSRRCLWANSKLSFDDTVGHLGVGRARPRPEHIACGRLDSPQALVLSVSVEAERSYIRRRIRIRYAGKDDGPLAGGCKGPPVEEGRAQRSFGRDQRNPGKELVPFERDAVRGGSLAEH